MLPLLLPLVVGTPSARAGDTLDLDPKLQVQTWATLWDQDEDPQADPGGYGDPEDDPGFGVRRARLGLGGEYNILRFNVLVGSSRPYDSVSDDIPPLQLIEAWAGVRKDWGALGALSATMGSHGLPYSREAQMSSNDLVFQERSVNVNWLASTRDLGVSAAYEWRWFKLTAGLFNGNGTWFGDIDPGLLYVARLDFELGGDSMITKADDSALGIGAAYLHEDEIATKRDGVNVDLLARYHGVSLLLEGNMTTLRPTEDPVVVAPTIPEKTVQMGASAQLSWFVRLPLGGLEPAARFAWFDDATHLKDNGDVAIIDAGVSWRDPLPGLDIGAGFIHRAELQGRAIDNDTIRLWTGFHI